MMWGLTRIFALIGVCAVPYSSQEDVDSETPEDALVEHLLSHYRKHGTIARPVKNVSGPIDVKFGLRVINVAVLEKEQTLTMSAWCRIWWYDEKMKWDPDAFGGIQYFSVPHDQVWTPDIDLANTADAEKDERLSLIQVKYTGRMFWTPHMLYNSACLIDVTDYPYDQHTCTLWFQSLGIHSDQLNILPYNVSVPFDLDTYIESYKKSQQWDLLNNVTERFRNPRDAGAILMYSRRPALRFQITLRRRVGFKAYLVMLPCLLLSFMTCLVFGLPPERPDRHMLAMSLFASFVVLLLILVEAAPPSAASVPKLGYYYGCCVTMIIASIFCSAFVIFISRKVEIGKPVPFVVKKIFVDVLGTVLCLNWRKKSIDRHQLRESQRQLKCEPNVYDVETGAGVSVSGIEDPIDNIGEDRAVPERYPGEHNQTNRTLRWLARMDQKLRKVESILTRPKKEQTPDIPMSVRLQWKTLTVVLDRIFLILFFSLNIVALVVFFPSKQYVE